LGQEYNDARQLVIKDMVSGQQEAVEERAFLAEME
jgi:hypothetical protein